MEPHSDLRMSYLSASAGAAIWVVLFVAALLGLSPLGSLESFFLLAPLVVTPLALALAARMLEPAPEPAALGAARVLQPFAALLATISFFFAPGPIAASLTGPWLLVGACAGLGGSLVIVRRDVLDSGLPRACAAAGLLYLPIGAFALALTRAGAAPLGFVEPIVLLTAVHFHFAAFAAPILAGATGRALGASTAPPFGRDGGRPSRAALAAYRTAAGGVVLGPALLASGWVLGLPALKMTAAFLLAASHLLLAAIAGTILPRLASPAARGLLAVAAGSAPVGMLLGAAYAAGEIWEPLSVGLPDMARVHGAANGLGFTLCGLVGWLAALRDAREPVRPRVAEREEVFP